MAYCSNGAVWMIVLACAIPTGVLQVWQSLLVVNLKPLHISQVAFKLCLYSKYRDNTITRVALGKEIVMTQYISIVDWSKSLFLTS